jgi:amino acid transporter
MFPRIFGKINRYGVPGVGLAVVSVLMTIVLFATMSPTIAGQFDRIINLAVILIVVPYVYASVAVVKVVYDRVGRGRTFSFFKVVALAAVGYCLWAIVGGDPLTVVASLVALLLSVPLYPFFIRSMEAAMKHKQESRLGAAAGSFQEHT